jgi:four helix bundle protein
MPRKTSDNNKELNSKVITNYTKLKVYQIAFNRAMVIFELSKKWPVEERYVLSNQIRRSSRSVCGNIAEAWRKRRYRAHFVSKLSDADAEAAETEVWLNFALKCGYITKSNYEELWKEYDYICRMLSVMMKNSDKWILKNI